MASVMSVVYESGGFANGETGNKRTVDGDDGYGGTSTVDEGEAEEGAVAEDWVDAVFKVILVFP